MDSLPRDAAGEALYVGDTVEPLRYSRGPVRIVSFHGGKSLLSDGLTIRTTDLLYLPRRTA